MSPAGSVPAVRVALAPPVAPVRPLPPLDASQARVVDAVLARGHVVVVGAPGSGKTTALLAAVTRRLHRGLDPGRLLVLAPTRAAAGALRLDLGARLGRTVREPLARTPHSLAFGILRRFLVLEGQPPPRLISGPEQDRILAEQLEGHAAGVGRVPGWPASVGPQVRALRGFRAELRDLLMRAAERGLSPADVREFGRRRGRPEWVAAADVYEEYLDITSLATPGAYDPAAIVDAATRALEGEPALLAEVRQQLGMIAVDDAQELTAAGQRLLALIGAGGPDVLLVGNPDEAAQTFRGARPQGLMELRAVMGGPGRRPALVLLERVHRHAAPVHAVAARVTARIGAAGVVGHRRAEPAPAEGVAEGPAAEGVPQVRLLASPAQEAAYIAAELRRRHLREGVPWSGMAVVVRSLRSTETLRRTLVAAGVPVTVPGAEVSVRDEPAVVPVRLALRCAVDADALTPECAVTLLAGPLAGCDALVQRRLRQALRAVEVAEGGTRGSDELLVAALRDPALLEPLPPALANPARRVAAVLAAGRQAAAAPDATAGTVLWAVWDATGLADPWRRAALAGGAPGARADRDLDAVVAVFEAAARFVDRLPNAGPASFLDYLEGQDLPADTLAERAPDGDAVTVLTASSAAGREWDVVVVAGVQDGVWPDLRLRSSLLGAQDLADTVDGRAAAGPASLAAGRRAVLDDELRLFLVAVTRARRSLLVTAVRSEDLLPSTFLDLVEGPAGGGHIGDEERALAEVPPGLSLPGMVARLRSVVTDPAAPAERAAAAARQLARLAGAGVPGADPGEWYGVEPATSEAAIRPDGAAVRVSPSRVESFRRCALRWFLEQSGGSTAGSTAQALGNLVHQLAEEVPDGDPAALQSLLEARFDTLGLPAGWLADVERARAATMVRKLAEYVAAARSAGRELVAAEREVTARVGRAEVRATVDRLERDGDGRLVVVDLKTGKSLPSKDESARHPQLGVYQLLVEEGAFEDVAPAAGSGGALLVGLGSPAQKVTTREQPPLSSDEEPDWAATLLAEVAEGMAGSRFAASVNPMCQHCPLTRSCPAHVHGRQVTS